MKYTDLDIHQRISLKGEFETNEKCNSYLAIMKLFNFVAAVEYFLNDDLDAVRRLIFED